jgi:restriction system protein
MWMVRAGRGGENVDEFLQKSVVALGWPHVGKLSPAPSKAELVARLAQAYPDEKEGTHSNWAGTLLRFAYELATGDTVVTYDRERRRYLVGTLTSGYEWQEKLVEDKPNVRHVKWTHQVARDGLSTGARNSLGAIQTLFKLSEDVAAELRRLQVTLDAPLPETPARAIPPPSPTDEEEGEASSEAELRAEVLEKADEFIEDAISRLNWKQMQDLVAGILRAMGYRTVVSPPGADRGVDIFASPDGLGLQDPRIFVEVKHRTGSAMGSKEIRAFLGGRKPGDKCLYVSTGGFSKDAHYEADRASVPITLLTLSALRKLLIDHYDALDGETRALVPLKRFYWPVV